MLWLQLSATLHKPSRDLLLHSSRCNKSPLPAAPQLLQHVKKALPVDRQSLLVPWRIRTMLTLAKQIFSSVLQGDNRERTVLS
eukprot:g60610.t1